MLSSGYYDAYYEKAQRVRTLIKHDFDEAFKDVDVILTPVTPTPAFKIGEKATIPSRCILKTFSPFRNLAGLPAISSRSTASQRTASAGGALPVGFQLIGKKWHEATSWDRPIL